MHTAHTMYNQSTDISNREPEIKHLCEDICEAFQEGIAVWDGRVEGLLQVLNNEKDLEAAKKPRASFEEGFQILAKTYMRYHKQAGAHFAIGDRTYVPFSVGFHVLVLLSSLFND